jgi:DsbC/DsbD-like thiol-disulfide interchange protein
MTSISPRSKRLLVGALLFVSGGVPASSAGYGPARDHPPQVTATIIPEARSIRPGSPLRVAIRLVVAPGWHIYWTNPGESGLPTTVRWTGPEGFTAGPVQWPYPERKELAGLVVHAYEGEVVLLGDIRPPPELPPGKKVEISAHMRWGVCREVCIPQEVRLSFSLPIRDRLPRPNMHWDPIAAAAALRIPHFIPGWTLQASWEEEGLVVRVAHPEEGRLPSGPLTFFPEDPALLPAAISLVPRREGRGLALRIKPSGSPPESPIPGRLRGVLVARSGWDGAGRFRALRVDVPIRDVAAWESSRSP